MKKQKEGYLQLYLGCEVRFVNEADKVKTYGEFERAHITGVFQCPSGAGLRAQLCVDDWEDPIEPLAEEIKLCLRQLKDMTKSEQDEMRLSCRGSAIRYMFNFHVEQVTDMLSKYFDLFGLIESGMAFDATTTSVQVCDATMPQQTSQSPEPKK